MRLERRSQAEFIAGNTYGAVIRGRIFLRHKNSIKCQRICFTGCKQLQSYLL
jgi:hypothetical protein